MKIDIVPFAVGDFNCAAIRDGDDWDRNVLLIKTGMQQILIDTGVGRDLYTPPALLLERLTMAGTPPEAIDLVILSHADFDHIGGAMNENSALAFPNARYVLPREEWDFWAGKPERLAPNPAYDEAFRRMAADISQVRLNQLRGRLLLIETDVEIVPGIHILAAPGHTPGYTVISVSSAGETFLYIGDLIYAPQDIADPDWVSVFDLDPVRVVATRNRFFELAAQDSALLMASHLPFPGLGYVSHADAGWRWQVFETKEQNAHPENLS